MANKIDYYLDMYSSEDYILNVVSAGNNGPDGSDYIQCVGAGNPGWDTSTCQRVNKYGHNILMVGNINDASNSNYSIAGTQSWKNGPTNDEAPHVVANGESVTLPWSETRSGTSFSAPAIASFAASLISVALTWIFIRKH